MTTDATNIAGGVDTDYPAAVDQQGRLLSFQELPATDCGSPTLLADARPRSNRGDRGGKHPIIRCHPDQWH